MEFYSFAKVHARHISHYESNFKLARLSVHEQKTVTSFMYLEENGIIGYHQAPVNQILYVVQGEGYVCNEQKRYTKIKAGEAVFWTKGEWHETKTDTGLMAVVIEGEDLSPQFLVQIQQSEKEQ